MSKKMKQKSQDITCSGLEGRLEDVLRYVQDLIEEYGKSTYIVIEGWDSSLTLYYEVLETDKEYERRLRNEKAAQECEKKRKAEKKGKEYKEFLRLQEKFGEK